MPVMAKDVVIARFIAAWPVAVKSHNAREKRPAWSARRKRKILLNMSRHERGKPGRSGLGVTISSHSASIHQPSANTASGDTVQQIKKQADRELAQYVQLVDQYRAIGPAALVAALLHTAKKRKTSITSKAA
jgi:hypothetical protein